MSELEKQTQQDREDDRDIRALMRETDYSGRLRDEFKRELLREINHNFRYHRLRSRILPVAVVVLVALCATWWTTDVGSDGFSLWPTGKSVNNGVVVEAPMTRMRFNAPSESTDTHEGIASAEGVYAQIAAGDARVVRLEIWTIGEDTIQFVWLDAQHDGEAKTVVRTIGGSSQSIRCLYSFRTGPARAMLKAIDHGSVTPHSIETTRALGRDFEMGTWVWETSECGPVVYKKSLR
jgi:hypothetical protein